LPRVGHVLRPALEAQHAALGIGLAGATVAAVVAFALRPLGGGTGRAVLGAVEHARVWSGAVAHRLLSLPLARGGAGAAGRGRAHRRGAASGACASSLARSTSALRP